MNNDIIILTIEIYIAGVKNRAGFATSGTDLIYKTGMYSSSTTIHAPLESFLSILSSCISQFVESSCIRQYFYVIKSTLVPFSFRQVG